MTVYGVDYSWGRPNPQELYRLGYRYVLRYLSYDTTGKNLGQSELNSLLAAGLSVISNWEWDTQDSLGGYSAGVEHAREAIAQARALGMPENRPIYFSVDFDVQPNQIPTVKSYFDGLASVLPRNRLGIYGSYRAVTEAASGGWCEWFWQTYAWSYGSWYPGNHVKQVLNGVYIAGADCDKNESEVEDRGQWGQGDEDEVSAKDVWQYDVDPSGGSYTAAGAQWTTFNRTGYLANDFAPTVIANLNSLNASSSAFTAANATLRSVVALVAIAFLIIGGAIGFAVGMNFVP